MDVQTQLRSLFCLLIVSPRPPAVQQEETIKMVELITMGTVSLIHIITSALCACCKTRKVRSFETSASLLPDDGTIL